MAWWTHILFFRGFSPGQKVLFPEEEKGFAAFYYVAKEAVYTHIVDILHLLLGLFTYLYLTLVIVTFFFEKQVPVQMLRLVEILSEPYLGALGIYVVVKEIERRRRNLRRMGHGEMFAIIWFFFFIIATLLTFFSEHYYLNAIYKTVVTNALAAFIIRLGALIR